MVTSVTSTVVTDSCEPMNTILAINHTSAAEPEHNVPSASRESPKGAAVGERTDGHEEIEIPAATPKTSIRFFAIIAALALSGLLTSLEATITSTALPTITADLGGADLYVWVVNGYYLTQTAFQPLFGQIADIYGRRWPMIISAVMFTLGSGLSGGASNINMLIAGRLIQGIGAGGINVLIEIIVCDLLPLRERGRYLGLMFGLIAIGTTLGPLFGGLIVQYSTWRWVFYLNVPIGGAAMVILYLFLRVKSDHTPDYWMRLKRIDWIGNTVFVLAMVSVLIALSWGGSQYPWSSFRIIVPLVMGFVGFGLFLLYEASPYCINPTMPLHLFANRTSGTAFGLTFLHSLSAISVMYFLPVYFQAVLAASPSRSGVDLLPTILFMIPAAITAGGLLSKLGRYRPIQHVGFALMIIGFGLLTLLHADATTGQWVGYQVLSALGTGLALPLLLPAVQASLTESDTALSTSTWSFTRSFGLIWGATIPTAAFNNRVNTLLGRVTDSAIAAQLADGKAYEQATKRFMDSITDPVIRAQVVSVYVDAIRTVWYVSMAFAGLAFLLVFVENEIPLRKELETKFSIEEKDGEKSAS
ncbi:MFS general substrate transporter [Aspergillus sclerotioniger CBS 115572]|uniref:MFS general substrate transporter n=1 Tax=Aspergillus sclerotioniger CBS 115572 TaxID=1450535 RepID=A0A317UX96_9EURO|nr:MFS general substrate transporter [Aspergillus sclerotioniger CBS 115572]PWY66365.1 MFS general substrate transporter [Aspergillus sclerotioniger CBS 115572]